MDELTSTTGIVAMAAGAVAVIALLFAAFLATRAGHTLNATEQTDLTLFRQQHADTAPEIAPDIGGEQSLVTVLAPDSGAAKGPLIVDIPIMTKNR